MSTTKNTQLTRHYLVLAGVILILVGFAIRLNHLAGDSFWTDELLTVNVVRRGLPTMMRQNDHPPLYYILTWLPMRLLGESEFSARLPSLLAGTIAPALLILLGKLLKRPSTGLWTALLLILSPFHLKYSQEARHYSVLMTFSLVTCILLILACQRPTWKRWLLYALATTLNMYLHYGSFMVLAAQSLLIGLWLLQQLRTKQIDSLRYPFGAALLVIAAYLPWLPRLQLALGRNVGADVVGNYRRFTPLGVWAQNVFNVFGTSQNILAGILLALLIVGLIVLIWRREYFNIAITLTGLLPFFLVIIFQVARQALPRYIIYVFPFYLLCISVAIDTLLAAAKRWATKLYVVGSAMAVMAAVLVFAPMLQAEIAYIQHDWRGALQYLDEHAQEGDVIIGMSMNFENGFNIVAHGLSYYLERWPRTYTFIPAHKLTPEMAAALATMDVNVWALLIRWNADPTQTADPSLTVVPFQTDLYLAQHNQPVGYNALDRAIAMYEKVSYLAIEPSPKCLLEQDLALLYLTVQDYENADNTLSQAIHHCPEPLRLGSNYRQEIANTLAFALTERYWQAGDIDKARRRASQILRQIDGQDPLALEVLTVTNLLTQFPQAAVAENGSPEPTHLTRWIMPQNGDWDDVLFTHPPTAVSYPLTLPTDPVTLRFRMALAPESWVWGGDGATFMVMVQAGEGAPTELFHQHIGNQLNDHIWHPGTVSLAAYAGQTITLTLSTDAGPAGDGTGDWAGWGSPRLVWEVEP